MPIEGAADRKGCNEMSVRDNNIENRTCQRPIYRAMQKIDADPKLAMIFWLESDHQPIGRPFFGSQRSGVSRFAIKRDHDRGP